MGFPLGDVWGPTVIFLFLHKYIKHIDACDIS